MAADGRRNRGAGGTRNLPRSESDRPPPPRERSPIRDTYNDRFGYRDPIPPPLPRDDPYYADPYRRPPPPSIDDRFDRFDDPYRRRDPYDDPYSRDPFYAPPPPRRAPVPPPIECEIIITHPQLRGYAEKLHDKIKALNMICGILSVPADQNVQKQLEDMSTHGVLYAMVVNSQNEKHSSVTLNILHGTPQEHRNMPIDDSVTLVGKNFEAYLREKAEKQRAPPPALSAAHTPAPFIPPPADIAYLLNLLADNRQLTLTEIEKIILYLRERRDKMLEAEGRRAPLDDSLYRRPVESSVKSAQSPVEREQEELKSKILSILNGGNTATSPPQPTASGYGDYSRQTETVHRESMPRGSSNPSMINFDSPSVQQALDNLIQTGPNLLKNINTGGSVTQAASTGSNARLSTAPQSSPGYGLRPAAAESSDYAARPGGYAPRPESDVGYGGHQARPAQLYGASAGHGASQPPGMRRY